MPLATSAFEEKILGEEKEINTFSKSNQFCSLITLTETYNPKMLMHVVPSTKFPFNVFLTMERARII